MGNSSFIENNSLFNFNEKNYLTFKTRRNRKLNLTEYYDLVYEYKNDCLTAGIKYKKMFYEDRDLKPSENLFFTISLIPLTTYEQKIDK
jgi:LPS-assembly protein